MSTGVQTLEHPALVLNRLWVPIHLTTVKHAIRLVYQEVARAVDPRDCTLHRFQTWADLSVPADHPCIHSPHLSLPVPEVVVLERYDKIPRRTVPFNRRNLYHRDTFRCQYCRRKLEPAELTIDHVLPRVQGGISSWENCVLACVPCNRRKAHRTPEQANMHLMKPPRRPHWTPRHLFQGMPRKASWEKIIGEAYWEAQLER